MERIRSYLLPIFAIFRRDALRLLKNPIALVIVVGMCILPALYSWYTIAAFWDPYQNTSSIKIAVANEDEGADVPVADHLDVGDQVVASLKENHELDWQFMDEQAALESVASGECYAAIVLPKDFSASFATLFNGTFTRPQIQYYVNEKLTGSGVKMVDTGATDVEKQIDEQFVQTVSEEVLTLAQKAGLQLEAGETSAEARLAANVTEAKSALDEAAALLDGLPADVDAASASLSSATDALTSVTDALPEAEARLDEAAARIAETRASLGRTASELGEKATNVATTVAEAATDASIAAGTAAGKVRQASADAQAAAAQAERAGRLSTEALSKLEAEAQGNPDLAQTLQSLKDGSSACTNAAQTLSEAASSLSATADTAASASDAISQAANDAAAQISAAAKNAQAETVPQMQASLDAADEALGALRGMLEAVGAGAQQTSAAASALEGSLEGAASTITSARDILEYIQSGLSEAVTDLGAVHASTALAQMERALKLDPDDVAHFLAAPVAVQTVALYPIKNYGTGVAPFFTNLALWVAGFILMAMVRIKVDPTGLPPFTERQAYFGRWLTYAALGSAQGIITGAGDIVLGIQCASPAAYLATCWLTALVYVNLMYGLAVALRHIGKAIAVVLLIIQIPGSSGMFPIQMLPSFYQTLNPLLPFTYSIDALREATGGFFGSTYLDCMLMLALIYLPLGFVVGLGLGRACQNLNVMFDEKLRATDFYQVEAPGRIHIRFRLRTVVAALADADAFRAKVRASAERFQALYPRLRRIGWTALFAVPVMMLTAIIVLRGNVDVKIGLVLAFFGACVLIAGALIALDYVEQMLRAQMEAAESSDEELARTLQAGSAHGPQAGQGRTGGDGA